MSQSSVGVEQKKKQKDTYYFLSTLAKGLKVVELLVEEGELSVSEVAAHLNINRTGSHRYLATLKEIGYVQQNDDRRYRLTYKIFELGMKIADRYSIRQEAIPYMQELASQFNETVNFASLDGLDVIHIEKIDSQEILRIDSPLGSRAPAYCTALGKAILAYLPPEDLEKYLETVEFIPLTPNTITSKKNLRTELALIREQAIAIDNEELSIGLRCVGAPILDHSGHPIHAISVSGVSMRMSPERIEHITQSVRSAGAQLSSKLGGTLSWESSHKAMAR